MMQMIDQEISEGIRRLTEYSEKIAKCCNDLVKDGGGGVSPVAVSPVEVAMAALKVTANLYIILVTNGVLSQEDAMAHFSACMEGMKVVLGRNSNRQ